MPCYFYNLTDTKTGKVIRGVIIVKEGQKCYGCIHDRPGQKDHMECPTGCLHAKEECSMCYWKFS